MDIREQNRKSAFNFIAKMRRHCQKACEEIAMLRSARNDARRKTELLKRTPGFIYSHELYLLKQGEFPLTARIDQLHASLLARGTVLRNTARLVDASIGFEELCDALNINRVDRRDLSRDSGFLELAFVHGLECSAERRKQVLNDSPLFMAVLLAVVESFGGAGGDGGDDKGGAPATKPPPSPVPVRCM